MQPEITQEFISHLSYESILSKETLTDSPLSVALNNMPVEYWDEVDILGNVTIKHTNQQELEERVLDFINQLSIQILCVKYTGEGEIQGFSLGDLKELYSTAYSNTVSYGGKCHYDSLSHCLQINLPNNYIIAEVCDEETGEELVYFFNTWSDISKEELDHDDLMNLLADFPHNLKAQDLGIEEECYGDIIQVPLSIISEYLKIER